MMSQVVGHPVRHMRSMGDGLRHNGILVAFAVAVLFMALAKQQFSTFENITNILQQNAVVGIIACGMTFAIIIGGFDLSVGATAALASVVCALVMTKLGDYGAPAGILAGFLAAAVVGIFNGALIAYGRINPFVATLGMMTIVRGLIYVGTNATPVFGVPLEFTNLGLGKFLGIPIVTLFFAGVALGLGAVLHLTQFGHHVYAVGGNAKAASVMGIDPRRLRFITYVLTSLCAALAGILLVGQTASGQPQAALGYELTAIAAVIVGGASLGGGHGRMLGSVVGVMLLGVVSNGLNLFGVSPFWQPVATGVILILAVAMDRTRSD